MIKKTRRAIVPPLVLIILSLVFASAQQKTITDLKPTVILISIDGFRSDYLEKYKPVNLNQLAKEGARAKWLIPSFPTKTFPNHYTIATGLYPEHHGIVENTIYDREQKLLFKTSDRTQVQNGRWWLGEPIWITAEKQGQRTAALFFPGSEAEIKGRRPTFWKPYDGDLPDEARVNMILSWLDLPATQRPTLLTLYFSDVDDAGHAASPDSPRTRDAVQKVDRQIGLLMAGLKARQIFSNVSLIIVSDHGMATVDPHHVIVLDELFDTSAAEKILWTPEIVSIFPKAGKEQTIYERLKAALPAHAQIFRKEEMPARFHYSDSPRIAPLLVLPEEGWSLMTRQHLQEMTARGEMHLKGSHGYDNQLASMRALFIAHGNAFKKGMILEPFANIEIYNIMCRILGLEPAPNDGSSSVAEAVLAGQGQPR